MSYLSLQSNEVSWSDNCTPCANYVVLEDPAMCSRLTAVDGRCFRGDWGKDNHYFEYLIQLPPVWVLPIAFVLRFTFWALGTWDWSGDTTHGQEETVVKTCDESGANCVEHLRKRRINSRTCVEWSEWSDPGDGSTFDPVDIWERGGIPCFWDVSVEVSDWNNDKMRVFFGVWDEMSNNWGLTDGTDDEAFVVSDFSIEFLVPTTTETPTTTTETPTTTTSLPTTTTSKPTTTKTPTSTTVTPTTTTKTPTSTTETPTTTTRTPTSTTMVPTTTTKEPTTTTATPTTTTTKPTTTKAPTSTTVTPTTTTIKPTTTKEPTSTTMTPTTTTKTPTSTTQTPTTSKEPTTSKKPTTTTMSPTTTTLKPTTTTLKPTTTTLKPTTTTLKPTTTTLKPTTTEPIKTSTLAPTNPSSSTLLTEESTISDRNTTTTFDLFSTETSSTTAMVTESNARGNGDALDPLLIAAAAGGFTLVSALCIAVAAFCVWKKRKRAKDVVKSPKKFWIDTYLANINVDPNAEIHLEESESQPPAPENTTDIFLPTDTGGIKGEQKPTVELQKVVSHSSVCDAYSEVLDAGYSTLKKPKGESRVKVTVMCSDTDEDESEDGSSSFEEMMYPNPAAEGNVGMHGGDATVGGEHLRAEVGESGFFDDSGEWKQAAAGDAHIGEELEDEDIEELYDAGPKTGGFGAKTDTLEAFIAKKQLATSSGEDTAVARKLRMALTMAPAKMEDGYRALLQMGANHEEILLILADTADSILSATDTGF